MSVVKNPALELEGQASHPIKAMETGSNLFKFVSPSGELRYCDYVELEEL